MSKNKNEEDFPKELYQISHVENFLMGNYKIRDCGIFITFEAALDKLKYLIENGGIVYKDLEIKGYTRNVIEKETMYRVEYVPNASCDNMFSKVLYEELVINTIPVH